jgi:APA family basic amino acid/polyamine antiporter
MAITTTAEGLKRVVGLSAFAMTIVNCSIGSGIYALPAIIGIQLGAFSIFCYFFCCLMLAVVMLCYAEVGSRITKSGGSYAYIEAAFGPFAGFVANWMYTLGWGILGSAAVMNILADTLSVLFPVFVSPFIRVLLFFVLLAIMVLVNIRGVKHGARFIQIITVIKLLPLFGIILFGISHVKTENLQWQNLPSLQMFGNSALVLFFAFAGFETSLNASGEITNPKRNVPLGILIGGVVVLLVYMFIQIVTQGVLGNELSAYKEAPLAAVAARIFGPGGATFLVWMTAVSCFGILSSDVLATPRLLFAGANDGLFPKFFGKVHPVFATPWIAILIYAGAIFIFSVSGGFRQLAILASAAILLIYLAVILATIKLRRMKSAAVEQTFSIPGGLLVPIAGIIAIVWLLSGLSKTEIIATVIFIAVICVFYIVMKKLKKETIVIVPQEKTIG